MTFRKEEIRVEADVTLDEKLDFVTYRCPACDHPDDFHPEMVAPDDASIWCAECGHDFGTWPDFRAKLFPGVAMLTEALGRKPNA